MPTTQTISTKDDGWDGIVDKINTENARNRGRADVGRAKATVLGR